MSNIEFHIHTSEIEWISVLSQKAQYLNEIEDRVDRISFPLGEWEWWETGAPGAPGALQSATSQECLDFMNFMVSSLSSSSWSSHVVTSFTIAIDPTFLCSYIKAL